MSARQLLAAFGLGALTLVVPPNTTLVSATTHDVPGAFDTIALALANVAVVRGDVIEVAYDHDETGSSALVLESGVSLIAGPGATAPSIEITDDFCIIAADTSSLNTVLSGFTITGFGVAAIAVSGGGVNGGEFVIENCYIPESIYSSWALQLFTSEAVRVRHNVIEDNGIGMYLGSASGCIVEENHLVGCGAGILIGAGYPIVKRNTIEGGYIAIEMDTGSNATIRQNIIYNNTIGVGCLGGSANVYNNDVFDNGTNYETPCSDNRYDNVSEDPYFCDGDITLHAYSICAPANNAYGVLIGARGIACANGDLRNTATFNTSNVEPGGILVYSDFRILAGDSLTVDDGVLITVDDEDEGNLGADADENEIVVRGSLFVTGTGGSKVKFESSLGSPVEGEWGGITTSSAYPATVDIAYAEVRHAQNGLSLNGVDTATVTHSVFEDNLLDIGCSSSSTLPVVIDDNDFTVGSGSGVEFTNQADGCVVSNNTFTCDATTVSGIEHGLLCSGSTPQFIANIVSGFTNGKGINVTSGSPTLLSNVTQNGKYGIYVSGGSPIVGSAADTTVDNISTGNSTAGLYITGSSTTGTVRQGRFTGNGTGVITKGNSNPNLGDSGQDGMNNFAYNSTYCMWNQSTSGTVSARGNYRGACDFSVCWSGAFDLANAKCSVPSGVQWAVEEVPEGSEGIGLRSVHPNPMRTQVRFTLSTGDRSRLGKITVYDVSGRVVRTWAEREFPTGVSDVDWDARDDEGNVVSNGIYFVRVQVGGVADGTTKILVNR